MDLTTELSKLSALHASGALTAGEFAAAKARLIRGSAPTDAAGTPRAGTPLTGSGDDTLGRAANRYVSFSIAMSIVGIVLFAILASSLLSRGAKPSIRIDPGRIELPGGLPIGRPADGR